MDQSKIGRKASLGDRNRSGVLRSALLALLITPLLSAALVLLTSTVLYLLPRGEAYISTVGAVMGLLTSLLGGVIAGRRNRHAGALAGLIFGLFYLALILLLARFVGTGAPFVKRLFGFLLFPTLSTLGGALGGMRRERRTHRKRRRR